MAKRIFSLPRLDQLTKDQRKVLRLKEEGQYLIVGSPGTGKSVVALLRARDYQKCLFLTYNHVLETSTKQLYDGDIDSHTAMGWFYQLYWQLTEGKSETFNEDKMPEREPHKPDYELVQNIFKKLNKDFSDYQIVIDEGQDLPPGWYDCLVELGIENFFIVADQNQQLTVENSNKNELKTVLGLENNDIITLEENWRNTAPIAVFCNFFYTDKTSPKPFVPDRPSTDIPILFEYSHIEKISEMILNEYDRDPSKLIGFFVPNDDKREWYVKKLSNDQVQRSNSKPLVSTYSSGQKGNVNIDFSYGGIVVLNDMSVKGIEFDTVFIIIDDYKMNNIDIERLQKRFYVMSSRAREKLFLFKSTVRPSMVEKILPKAGEIDEKTGQEILKRRQI